jgi:hypothetical protein
MSTIRPRWTPVAAAPEVKTFGSFLELARGLTKHMDKIWAEIFSFPEYELMSRLRTYRLITADMSRADLSRRLDWTVERIESFEAQRNDDVHFIALTQYLHAIGVNFKMDFVDKRTGKVTPLM